MPLYFTASSYSALKRSNSSPAKPSTSASSLFNNHARTKSSSTAGKRKRSKKGDDEDGSDEDEDASPRLSNTGKTLPLAANSTLKTVPEAIDHALCTTFGPIPDRAAGMNSTKIAELLNFRKRLPPVVSLAHIHALITASTRTEREIAQLITTGTLRKIPVAGRGNDISGLGEFIIRTSDLEDLISKSSLADAHKDKFKTLLRDNPRATNLPALLLEPSELTALVKAGFLVTASAHVKISTSSSARAQFSSSVTTASRTPSGSILPPSPAAFENHRSGAGNSATNVLTLSVPNLGPYLRLLSQARNHLLDLLARGSKYSEAPAYLLKERWDGASAVGDSKGGPKRVKGQFQGVLPGQTRRWRQLYGLEFPWVLDECLGSGLIEGFETGAVGLGVRAV